MFELNKTIVKIGGLLFLVLVLAFTGLQTYSLLYTVSGSAVTAAVGLVLFEGGMIYWWQEFKSDAEGLAQMALSLLLAILGLLLVATSTALHLGAVDNELIGPQTPARLITIAALINLAGKFAFPLLSPETFKQIWSRALQGMVVSRAYAKAQVKAEEMSAALAEEIGNEIVHLARIGALTQFGLLHDGHGHGRAIEHDPNEATGRQEQPPPAEPAAEPVTAVPVTQQEEPATALPFRPQANGFRGGEG
jgi:hypothetical protein